MDLIIIDHGMTIFVQVEEIQDRLPVVQIPSHLCTHEVTLALKLNSERKKRQETGHLTIHDAGDAVCYTNPVLQAADREFVAREAADAKAAADKAAADLVLQAERAQEA